MQNLSKAHEKNVQTAVHGEQVSNILDNVENVPFALRGATVKTILYFLFSFIAASELTAALTFYTMSMGLSLVLAAVFCGLIAFGFHALLHGILSDTAKGIVFGKRKESGAMSNEVTGNIILSIVLLGIASCTVFFVGKKGFTAYRATQYEKKQDDEKGKLPPIKSIDASMLTNSKGKIAAWKLETLTDLEKAKATTTEKQQAKDENEPSRLISCDIPNAKKFTITLFSAFAERERMLISLRTRQALGAKKERGETWDRNNVWNDEQREKAIQTNRIKAEENENTIRAEDIAKDKRKTGMTLEAIADYLNAKKFRTPNGKLFGKTSVKRLIEK